MLLCLKRSSIQQLLQIALGALFVVSFILLNSSKVSASDPYVHEVTLAAPDIIRIEIRETGIKKGRIEKLNAPQATDQVWAKNKNGKWGRIIGPKRGHIKIVDQDVGVPLRRDLIDQADLYGSIGKRRVVDVYRKSEPWSSGWTRGSNQEVEQLVSFRHFIYLNLDNSLQKGDYIIKWPNAVIEETEFRYDPSSTRLSAIRASQLGHRASDSAKYAYLSLWLPEGPNSGAVDFRDYGLNKFRVVNANGNPVFNGAIELRASPTSIEKFNGIRGDLVAYQTADGSIFHSSRAGTYVFGLDYSQWKGAAPGIYRIEIPGVGVSDPFEIGDNVWGKAAQVAFSGMYHQRSGIELDGRFGYKRPACLSPMTKTPVFESGLPFIFSSESQGFIPFKEGAKDPWITSKIRWDAWGGYHDAGDWDRRIQHLDASYLLLDVYEMLSAKGKAFHIGIPSSDEVFPNSIYKGANLPDVIDEAIWNIDFFRRLQRQDGAVSGGVEGERHPKQGETCWLNSAKLFSYTPDARSSYIYASTAAKLALVLDQIGEVKLSNIYKNSAIRAWNWAESKGDAATQEALKRLSTKQKGKAATFLPKISKTTDDARLRASAVLSRLTNEVTFKKAFSAYFEKQQWMSNAYIVDGAWEYTKIGSNDRNKSLINKLERQIVSIADKYILDPQSQSAYINMKHRARAAQYGAGLAPSIDELSLVMRAHQINGASKYLSLLANTSAHILGANQIGMSFTTGVGARPPLTALHEDTLNAGITPPDGITIYGWIYYRYFNATWLWDKNWSALSQQHADRRVEPFRKSLPFYEYIIQHPLMIPTMEYTLHQSIAPTAAMWLYLHSHHSP